MAVGRTVPYLFPLEKKCDVSQTHFSSACAIVVRKLLRNDLYRAFYVISAYSGGFGYPP